MDLIKHRDISSRSRSTIQFYFHVKNPLQTHQPSSIIEIDLNHHSLETTKIAHNENNHKTPHPTKSSKHQNPLSKLPSHVQNPKTLWRNLSHKAHVHLFTAELTVIVVKPIIFFAVMLIRAHTEAICAPPRKWAFTCRNHSGSHHEMSHTLQALFSGFFSAGSN